METERSTDARQAEEKTPLTPREKAFLVFSGIFFGTAVISLLALIYVMTAKDLEISPYATPVLYLLFGGGLGFGMLFRTFRNKEENVSPINYYFKIAFSILILLSALLSFLINLLQIVD